MGRPIFDHKIRLRGPSTAASTVTQSPVSTLNARWWANWEQNGLQTTVATYGMTAPTATGTASSVQDSTGSYINYLSGTAASAQAGWATAGGVATVQKQLLPDLEVVLKTGAGASDVASLRIWAGLQTNGAIGTDTPGASAAISSLLFRYSTPAGDSNWMATASDGSSDATPVDTGVAVTADTRYVMRIKVVSASSVEYYINDLLVATITTALPAASTNLFLYASTVNAGAGTARNLRLRKFYIDAL